ncbi:hypothetical protein ACFU7T_34840 [Streptomyces sp. NPDC057555]|uniref:hypothetical protein n=1 Tax=Streptomyces sp. NPDC057555 TaxID=3346166 RepID=UPI00368EF5A4
MLVQRIAGAHSIGDVLLEAPIVSNTEIAHPVHTVLDPGPHGLQDVAALQISLGVFQGCDGLFGVAQVDRRGLQRVRRILRIERAVLEAGAEHLRPSFESLSRRAVPVLADVRHRFVQ